MQLLSTILLGAVAQMATAAMLPLDDVFDVSLENKPWGCKLYYKSDNKLAPLNMWWKQINEMNDRAKVVLGKEKYNQSPNSDTAHLALSMFGIMKGKDGKEPKSSVKGEEELDAERLKIVRARFAAIDKFIHTKAASNAKAKLLCDMTYLQYQLPCTPAMDPATGKARVPEVTLEEYEKSQGREEVMDENWYFWYDVPNKESSSTHERAYQTISKYTFPGYEYDDGNYYPFQMDSNGHTSMCHESTAFGGTFLEKMKHPGSTQTSNQLFLCMDQIMDQEDDSGASGDFDWTDVRQGGELNQLFMRSMLFYSQIMNLDTSAPSVQAPYLYHDDDPKNTAKWPEDRQSWKQLTRGTAQIAMGASLTALYDRCTTGEVSEFDDCELAKIPQKVAVHTPDNLIWFAFASLVAEKTGFEFSSLAANKGPAKELDFKLQKQWQPTEAQLKPLKPIRIASGKFPDSLSELDSSEESEPDRDSQDSSSNSEVDPRDPGKEEHGSGHPNGRGANHNGTSLQRVKPLPKEIKYRRCPMSIFHRPKGNPKGQPRGRFARYI